MAQKKVLVVEDEKPIQQLVTVLAENYSAADHVRAHFTHGGQKLFDYCIVNSEPLPEAIAARYRAEGACQTVVDDAELEALGVRTIRAPLLDCSRGFARHDPKKLAAEIMRLYQEEAHTKIYG